MSPPEPASFLETTPPRVSSTPSPDPRRLRHARSFSRFLFGGSKNKTVAERPSVPQLPESVKTLTAKNALSSLPKRVGPHSVGHPDSQPVVDNTTITPSKVARASKPILSINTNTKKTPKLSSSVSATTPTRPSNRPSFDVFAGPPFEHDDPFLSPIATSKFPKVNPLTGPIRTRGESISSDADSTISSHGPTTPLDDPHLLTSSASLPLMPSRYAENSPPAAIYTLNPKKTSDFGFHSVPSPSRPPLPHASQSFSSIKRQNDRSTPSPISVLKRSGVSVPPSSFNDSTALRDALIAQQQRCLALSRHLTEIEAQKSRGDKKIAMLEEEAAERSRELEGLRWLMMNVGWDCLHLSTSTSSGHHKTNSRGSVTIGGPLKRTRSMPLTRETSSSSSSSTSTLQSTPNKSRLPTPRGASGFPVATTEPLAIRTPKRVGLGINGDKSIPSSVPTKPLSRVSTMPPSSSSHRRNSVSVESIRTPSMTIPPLPGVELLPTRGLLGTSLSEPSIASRKDLDRMNTLDQLDLLSKDLRKLVPDAGPSPRIHS